MASTTTRTSEIVGLGYSDDHVMHAKSLRFAVTPDPYGGGFSPEDTEDGRRLIAAVDAALALRAGADVEDLEIDFVYDSATNFDGLLRRPAVADPAVRKLTVELPASARAEAMTFNFGDAALTVPAAGAFHVLTDLQLSHGRVEPSSADERNLGDLLSASSCPRLGRLRLERVGGLAAFRLRAAATLEELRLDNVRSLTALELDAPGLRELHVSGCYRLADSGSTARISVPALETLACADMCLPDGLEIVDAPASLRCLEKVYLYSHAPDEDWNAGAVGLLQLCTDADSLGLELDISPFEPGLRMEDTKEMMSCVPLLPNITNLTINVNGGRWHELKATISTLAAKCGRVQCLSIDIKSANDLCPKVGCLCNVQDDPTISLEHLREAKITGFGTKVYHWSLVQLMITGAPALEKMTVEFIKASPSQRQQNHDSEDLGFNMPCKGQWSLRHGDVAIYEWTADSKREEDERILAVLICLGYSKYG
ncbi:unnamed protein product [Urochloa decumbens]|uniref:Uncharacterized protein n=1 Tax=Urochloa decumbens TaxID=240449 RepID=A0ABC8WAT3_9POAL